MGYGLLSHVPRGLTYRSKAHALTNLEGACIAQHGQVTREFCHQRGSKWGRVLLVGVEVERGGGDDRGALAPVNPEALRHQQRSEPFYGPMHLWHRAEFGGRGHASGQKHQAPQAQAQGVGVLQLEQAGWQRTEWWPGPQQGLAK